jgi:hypothetical protein
VLLKTWRLVKTVRYSPSCDDTPTAATVAVKTVHVQIVSAQFVSAQIVSAQIVSGTNCIGGKSVTFFYSVQFTMTQRGARRIPPRTEVHPSPTAMRTAKPVRSLSRPSASVGCGRWPHGGPPPPPPSTPAHWYSNMARPGEAKQTW